MSIRLKVQKDILFSPNPYANDGDIISKSDNQTSFSIKAKSGRNISLVTSTDSGVIRAWTFNTDGNITLPLGGDILKSDGTTILNVGSGPTTFSGNVTGNLTGNVTGNLTGNVTGNVTGDVTGNLTGNVIGNIKGLTVTTTTGTLSVSNSKTLTVSNTLTFAGTDSSSIAFGAGGIVAYTGNKLNVFASTSSDELRNIISDETGTGSLVFSASPTFTGIPLAPTATAGTNTTQIATTAYVRQEVANLVASSPSQLDTLNELATALGNDASFSSTITTALGTKAPLESPTFTGTVSGITKSMVGLSNVTNESKATMFTTPTFTGILTASDTTEASAYDTAAVVLSGGLGVAKSIRSNGALYDSKGEVRNLPQNSQTSSYTITATDIGKHISITTGGVTIAQNILSIGDSIVIYNNSSSNQTITQGSGVTMYLGGTATTGNRTISQRGLATVLCVAANTCVIAGAGVS